MSQPTSPVEQRHPRKRQRTVEPRSSLRSTSPSTQAMPMDATAAESSCSGFPASVSTGQGTHSCRVSSEHPLRAASDNETAPSPARPDSGGPDGDGGAYSPREEHMNGSPTVNEDNRTRMSSFSQVGTQSAVPRTNDEGTCDHDCDRDRARGLDSYRHSASGAGTKTSLVMDIDASGLARATQTTSEPVRDAEYYIEGADCAIRVEDTLFRVHRYLLGRDHSAFQDMFDVPVRTVPSEMVEGLSDGNPIILYGESAEHFRALLSVLYALLLDIAVLCGHESLRGHVEKTWVFRIKEGELRPLHALDVAARTGAKILEGYAYYAQLLEMGSDFDPGVVEDGKEYSRASLTRTASLGAVVPPNGVADLGTPAVLTRAQKQRLLSGYWSLTRLWDKLRSTPPTFEQSEDCVYHQHGCRSTWVYVWREVANAVATEVPPAVDVLRRLQLMYRQLATHTVLSEALSPLCRYAALLSLEWTTVELEENLAAHFSDLIDGEDA
ncbi:hypothetical protein FKP32DRAFT_1597313 [Trametes sanguinea]|nr:hypothetical protein FKP32DRAFT_1597313 [Trametes sanguinea]